MKEPPPPDADEPGDEAQTHRFSHTFTFGTPPPPDGPAPHVVPGRTRRFEWRWERPSETPDADHELEPATYYEAFTGRPDPHRATFVSVRRVLNLALWVLALGIPIVLVTLAILNGESLETIVLMGAAGLLVGLLIRSSAPKTPFD